jgi:hypothetical protein
MKERDILWEGENLWLGKTGRCEYTIFKCVGSYSQGFLRLQDRESALDNAKALDGRMDIVEKLIK